MSRCERPSTRRCGGWPGHGRAAACSPPAASSSSSCSTSIRSGGRARAGYRISDQGILNIAFGARSRRDHGRLYRRARAAGARENRTADSPARRGRRLRQRPGRVLGRAAVDVPGLGQALGIYAATSGQAAAGRHACDRANGADRRVRAGDVGCDRRPRAHARMDRSRLCPPDRRRCAGSRWSRVRTAAEALRREYHRAGDGIRAAGLIPIPRDEGLSVRLPPGRDPAASGRRSDRAHLEHPVPAETARNRPPAGDRALLAARTRACAQASSRMSRHSPSRPPIHSRTTGSCVIDSSDVKDKSVAIVGGLSVAVYLVAIGLTPHARPTLDHLVSRSSTGRPSTALNCSQATCCSPSGWRCSWSSPPGCIASSGAPRARTAGSRWPRWRARSSAPGSSVPAPRCSWSSPTGRPQIPLWRGRFGTPAGWPTTPLGSRLSLGSRSSP